MPTIEELGQRVRAKYPGAYDDFDDVELGRRVKAKYPGSYDDFTDPAPPGTERLGGAPGTPVVPEAAREAVQEQPGRLERFGRAAARNAGEFLSQTAKMGIAPGGALPPPLPSEDQTKAEFQQQAGRTAETYQQPLAPLSELADEKGFIHGALRGGERLTTPVNIATLVALPAVGAMVRTAPSLAVQAAYDALDVGLAAYFTGKTAESLHGAWKEGKTAWENGDYQGVADALGLGTVDGLMLWLVGNHTIRNAKQVAESYRIGIVRPRAPIERQVDTAAPGEPSGATVPETPAPPKAQGPAGRSPSVSPPNSEIAARILSYLRSANVPQARGDIYKALTINPNQAAPALQALEREGQIESRRDQGGTTIFTAKPSAEAQPAATPAQKDATLKQQIVGIAQREGRVTRQGIRNAFDLSTSETGRLLSSLIQEGSLDSRGRPTKTPGTPPAQQPSLTPSAQAAEAAPAPTPPETPPVSPESPPPLARGSVVSASNGTRYRINSVNRDRISFSRQTPDGKRGSGNVTAAEFGRLVQPEPNPEPEAPLQTSARAPAPTIAQSSPGVSETVQSAPAPPPGARGTVQPATEAPVAPRPEAPARMSASQRGAIFARRADLGLTQAELRQEVERATGQPSVRSLTGEQAGQVLARLREMQPKPVDPNDVYPKALALAREQGRISASAIVDELGVPRPEAQRIYGRLVSDMIVNPAGRLREELAAQQPAEIAAEVTNEPVPREPVPEAPASGQPPRSPAPAAAAEPPAPPVDVPPAFAQPIESIPAPAATLPAPVDTQSLSPRAVELAKREGRATASSIAEALGIPRDQAKEVYLRLVSEMVVTPAGKLRVPVPSALDAKAATSVKSTSVEPEAPATPRQRDEEGRLIPQIGDEVVGTIKGQPVDEVRLDPAAIEKAIEQRQRSNGFSETYGIRVLHPDENYSVGDALPPSFDWDDGYRTETELLGTAAFEVGEDPQAAVTEAARYKLGSNPRYVLIAGKGADWTLPEKGSVVISDAVVIAKFLGFEPSRRPDQGGIPARTGPVPSRAPEAAAGERTPRRPPRRPSRRETAARAAIRDHYAPGNVVWDSYWRQHDKVLAFDELPDGRWEVEVQGSDAEGNPRPGELVRRHSTPPGRGDRVVRRSPEPASDDTGPLSPDPSAGERTPPAEPSQPGAVKRFLDDESGEFRPEVLVRAARLIQDGVTRFRDWSARMIEQFGETIRPYLSRIYAQVRSSAENILRDTRGAVGNLETGPHGPIFREFRHDAPGAIAKLRERRTGEAVGALQHPELGDIDLVWGRPGSPAKKFKDGFGLAHILAKHEEMRPQIDRLGEIIEQLPVAAYERDGDEVRLENDRYRAIVSTAWQPKGENRQEKVWLLTAFEPKAEASSATDSLDAGGTPRERGDGTTTPSKEATSTIAPKREPVNPPKSPRKPFLDDESGELRLDRVQEFFSTPINLIAKTKNPAKALGNALKHPERALKVMLPLETNVSLAGGGAGKPIAQGLQRAGTWGKVSAGKRLLQLSDAGLAELNREQRFNLQGVLEGREDPIDDKVWQAAQTSRALLDDLAAEAEVFGVMVKRGDEREPFRPMRDYYPHMLHGPDALRSGQLRKDIIENLVRLGVRDDAKTAETFLDDYVRYLDSGARQESLLEHMVETGQAENTAEAFDKLRRFNRKISRYGNLEFAREVNLPFYDPDPGRVLPEHIKATSIRLAQIGEFGADNHIIQAAVKDILDAPGKFQTRKEEAEWVDKAVKRVLGYVDAAESKAERRSRALRAVQGFKLGLAAVPNSTQGTLNTLLVTDLPSVAVGFVAQFTQAGKRFAIESGSVESILHEITEEIIDAGPVQRGLQTSLRAYLTATGFGYTERLNRTLAANAGGHFAERQMRRLRNNPQDEQARGLLEELGIDVDAALERGGLTWDDVLVAANRITEITQFSADPGTMPLWASTPAGKVFWQYKQFPYRQTGLILRSIVKEFQEGRTGRGFRNALILATLFPLAGLGVRALRDALTGRERDEEGPLEAWLEGLGQAGATGIFDQVIEGGKYGRGVESLAGPTVGTAGDLYQIPFAANKSQAAVRAAERMTPLSRVVKNLGNESKYLE